MAQLMSPGGSRSSGTVSVADLVSRNARVPAEVPGSEPTPAVSVDSLLRREAGSSEAGPDENDNTQGTVRGAVVRGVTIVAGSALVVGSAFGGAVLVETFFLDPAPTAGAAPTTSAPDETTVPAATPGALVDRAAAGPDAGTGAPTAWAEVAFPKAVTGGTQARNAVVPVTTSPSAASQARSTPAASATDQKASDQEKEPAGKSATTPATSATTEDSTSDKPASSSGSTAQTDGGLVDTVVHPVVKAVTGVLGLGG